MGNVRRNEEGLALAHRIIDDLFPFADPDFDLALELIKIFFRIDQVKIIPFAVGGAVRDAAISVARASAPLVRVAPYRVRKVGVVSTIRTSPPMVADELRRQADNFIELDELKGQISRDRGKPQFAQSA